MPPRPGVAVADILVVEPARELAEALQGACRRAGLQVEWVGDGAEALSTLDWHPPRGLLCSASLPDMFGWELCAIVREDPRTRQLPFVLLVDPGDESRDEIGTCGASLVAPRGGSVHLVPTLLRGLIGERGSPVQLGPSPASEATLRGTFSVMGLPDLVQTIAMGEQPGCLTVTIRGVHGSLYFQDGRLVDAEFEGVLGEPAVANLLDRTEGRQGSFCFMPAPGGRRSRTITKGVSQLLLDIAAELDHRRAHPSDAVPPAPRTR